MPSGPSDRAIAGTGNGAAGTATALLPAHAVPPVSGTHKTDSHTDGSQHVTHTGNDPVPNRYAAGNSSVAPRTRSRAGPDVTAGPPCFSAVPPLHTATTGHQTIAANFPMVPNHLTRYSRRKATIRSAREAQNQIGADNSAPGRYDHE